MQQYFLKQKLHIGDTIKMDKEQAHHIGHVLRMSEHERIRVADHEGHMFFAHVHFLKETVMAVVEEELIDDTKNEVEITLAQGLIKKEKWDFLLQKSAELGVTRILPFSSSRTIVKAKEERLDKKLQRWQKILLEACEQCKRSTLVELAAPVSFSDLAAMSEGYDLKLVAYENADSKSESLKALLTQYPRVKKIFICIGSEGGFSEEEVAQLMMRGFHMVSLGARILRAETAALSMINSLSFYYERTGDVHEDAD